MSQWVPFGTLIDHSGPLAFSGNDMQDGMPRWERPLPGDRCGERCIGQHGQLCELELEPMGSE